MTDSNGLGREIFPLSVTFRQALFRCFFFPFLFTTPFPKIRLKTLTVTVVVYLWCFVVFLLRDLYTNHVLSFEKQMKKNAPSFKEPLPGAHKVPGNVLALPLESEPQGSSRSSGGKKSITNDFPEVR